MRKIKTVAPREVYAQIANGKDVAILDVRTMREFRKIRIPNSTHVPLHELNPQEYLREHSWSASDTLYILCKAGTRASVAAQQFQKAGFSNVAVIEGGILQWQASGLPVEGAKPMSIERQVRLIVGTVVLGGALLGAMVHPAFFVLPAFMGGGLIMAGFTGKCPMENLLARMR